MVSAIRPYCEDGSSEDGAISFSKVRPMPAAVRPLSVKGFSVSYELKAQNLTSPPLGASGLAYSKFVKSGPYLSSPTSEDPWLTVISWAAAGATAARPRPRTRSVGAARRATVRFMIEFPCLFEGWVEGWANVLAR